MDIMLLGFYMRSCEGFEQVNILQVGRDVVDTGGGRVILETSQSLSSMGYNVCLLTDTQLDDSKIGFDVIYTPLGSFLKKTKPKNKITRTFRHFLQIILFTLFGSFVTYKMKKKGWLVFNHNLEVLCGDVLVLHNVFNAEYVKEGRKGLNKIKRWANPVFVTRVLKEKWMLRYSSASVACGVSSATADEALPWLSQHKRLVSINNGVDAERFSPLTDMGRKLKRNEMGFDEKFVLVFVGYEFERKGVSFLIEAMGKLPKDVVLLLIGGSGSTVSFYEALADDFGVSERVFFLGDCFDTWSYYRVADAFVLPTSYEAWPLVGLEAMACGVPALMTSVGGIPEFLEDGENGLFIERQAQDIADKVSFLMEHPELLSYMRNKAREVALNYSWESVACKYLELACEIQEEKKKFA